ncbi:MAG: hypothetical protein BAA01_10970 [Bacillus thermozeamaize]|uniref:DUF2521 domain-containing protein n=1 Tax=Bacillus thermozeamaize TaxID=230954 RepID=A0A1Y3PP91_9BACI|nr:MAG: hypothetical protein BAA01_10970 [Bacillus thermozeamaize]
MNNVVDFQAYQQRNWDQFRERAVHWLDPAEYQTYYQEMVSWVLARANWYERYLVEEALFETLLDGFCMGLEASRRYKDAEKGEKREQAAAVFKQHYLKLADESVRRYSGKYHLFHILDEWTYLSIQIVLDDCICRWFEKGFREGMLRKKRKQW